MAQGSDRSAKASIDDSDLEIFFGKNAQYYLTENEVMERSGSRVSWNWPAFLFSFAWMYYRKLWAPATLAAVAIIVFNSSIFFQWMAEIFMLLVGMYGNAIYLTHAKRKVAEAGLSGRTSEHHRDVLQRVGGTSWPAAIISVLVSIIITVTMLILWGGVIFAFFSGLFLWLVRESQVLG